MHYRRSKAMIILFLIGMLLFFTSDFELIDNEGRRFPVKRYKVNDCRFKVYNMAKLSTNCNFSKIVDKSLNKTMDFTSGNYKKGVK